MKKVLSLALILSLMMVSIFCFPASAASDFAAVNNWRIYGSSATLNDEIADPPTWAHITENTNSAYANGDSNSLKLQVRTYNATLPISVEPNTEYVVSYKIYSETSAANLITDTGVIPKGNSVKWGDENTYFDFIANNIAYRSENGLFSKKVGNTQRTTAWSEAKKWHTVKLTFNSGENTTVMLTIKPNVEYLYVDDITVKKPDQYFENAANWVESTGNIFAISDTSFTPVTQFYTETSINNVYEGLSSLRSKITWGNFVGIKLPNLKANTEYTFSFKHKVITGHQSSGRTNYLFYGAGAYVSGTDTAYTSTSSYGGTITGTALATTGDTTPAYSLDTWNDYSIKFTTGTDTNAYFVVRYLANYVHLDDITLTETPVHPQINDWKVYSSNTTYVNEAEGVLEDSWSSISTCDVASCTYSNDECSLKLHSNFQYATYKFAVEKNARYTVSYNFMSETAGSLDRIIESTGVLAADSSVVWAAEKGYYNFLASNTAYTAKNGIFDARVGYSENTTKYKTPKTWYHIDLEFESGNNEYMYLVVRSRVEDLYVDGVVVTLNERNVVKVNTSYNGAAALRLANESSTGKNGLRIYNNILKQYLEDANVVEYGSIATYEALIGEDELSLETPETKRVKGVAYNSTTQTTPILYEETDDAYVFTSYLTNIPAAKYGANILVRAYVIDADGNVYYGDVVSVCVYQVAHAIDCGNSLDGSTPTDVDVAAFENFANYDGDYSAYDAWLAENNLTAGSLRNPEN